MKYTSTPYAERTFVIDDHDKILFALMKTIVDANFPPLDDVRCQALRLELYRRKRKYGYKELDPSTVYIFFPRVDPFTWIYKHIKFYLWSKHHITDDED